MVSCAVFLMDRLKPLGLSDTCDVNHLADLICRSARSPYNHFSLQRATHDRVVVVFVQQVDRVAAATAADLHHNYIPLVAGSSNGQTYDELLLRQAQFYFNQAVAIQRMIGSLPYGMLLREDDNNVPQKEILNHLFPRVDFDGPVEPSSSNPLDVEGSFENETVVVNDDNEDVVRPFLF